MFAMLTEKCSVIHEETFLRLVHGTIEAFQLVSDAMKVKKYQRNFFYFNLSRILNKDLINIRTTKNKPYF